MLALLAMLGGPIAGLFTSKVSFTMAKVVGGIALAVLLIALLGIGKCSYDRAIINAHDDKRDATIANSTVTADRAADAAAANRAAVFQNSQDVLTNAASAARAADPTGAAKPVGPVSSSYYDNLPDRKKKAKQ